MWSNVSFLLVRSVLGVLRLGPSADAKVAEIAVLRYRLSILQRQVPHPRYNHADRTVMSALSRLLPRSRWDAFMVTPATVLRWQRQRVRRHWTQRQRQRPARPGLPDDSVQGGGPDYGSLAL